MPKKTARYLLKTYPEVFEGLGRTWKLRHYISKGRKKRFKSKAQYLDFVIATLNKFGEDQWADFASSSTFKC